MGWCVELADTGRQHYGVRHLQQAVLGLERNVGQADAQHPGVDNTNGARSNTDVFTNLEWSGEEQHERCEDIAQTLLGRDAEHDARQSEADDEVSERDAQELEDRDEHEQVADTCRDEAHDRGGRLDRASREESSHCVGEATDGVDAGNQQYWHRDPGNQGGMMQHAVTMIEI